MTTVYEPKTDHQRRVELLSDLRVLLNWLEAHPEVPLPRTVEISCHVSHGSDEEGIGLLHAAARAAEVEVTYTADGAHHHATRSFGLASYDAVYVERQRMADWDRQQEIARRLVQEEKAAAEPAHCVCCTYDCGDRRGHVLDDRQFVTPELCVCGDFWPCERPS